MALLDEPDTVALESRMELPAPRSGPSATVDTRGVNQWVGALSVRQGKTKTTYIQQ